MSQNRTVAAFAHRLENEVVHNFQMDNEVLYLAANQDLLVYFQQLVHVGRPFFFKN